ncbi:MAG: Tat pathway signal protein [Acidobacteria bacterium]|nr:MAG: Tat pathway signal protein [Acidobacteriota bacterium]
MKKEEEELKAKVRIANAQNPRERTAAEWPSRRDFLMKLGVTAGVVGASGYIGYKLWDPDGEAGKPKPQRMRLKDFHVKPPSGASVLGIARGENYLAMLKMAITAIGGIAHYIRKGDVVLIKPNVAFDRAPKLGATTNPEVLSALIRLVREAGASEVRVADSPIESPESCFVKSGIREAAAAAGAELYLPSPSSFEMLEVPGATLIPRWPFFYRPFHGVDKVIGVAPIKDHNLCFASMTTKNWYGLLGGRRNQFHQDIHHIIADLATMMKPTFVILDASRILVKNGPTGGDLSDVIPGKTLVASTDQIAADAYGYANILNRQGELRYLQLAHQRGLGNPDWHAVTKKEEQVG